LSWIYNGSNLEIYKQQYGGAYGKTIKEISNNIKPNEKILSFISANSLFPKNVIVFTGNGSLTTPSTEGLNISLGEYKDGQHLKDYLLKSGFCCVVIDPSALYLSKSELLIINQFLANSKPTIQINNIKLYRLAD
jgi:hypothetical protein